MALAIDVSYWEDQRIQLQHIADVAALAGSARYAQTNNATAAVQSAASVAELNGVPAGTRTTSGSTGLTDNYGDWVTTYSLHAPTATLTATIQTSAPIWFGRLYTTATKQTISATATAQSTATITGHPCVLALQGDTTGVTTFVDITFSGNTSVSSSTCGVRSDGALSAGGSSSVAVPTVIASGNINASNNITCTSSPSCLQSGAPQIPDPFSSTYSNQLSIPSSGQAGSSDGSSANVTYHPGIYSSSLTFNSNVNYTLQPGIYYVNGSITINGGAIVSGTNNGGVTLISTNGISMNGNATVTLTAPSTGPTAGLLYGTSATSGNISIVGNSGNVLSGAIYAPNASIQVTGNSGTAVTPSACLVVVGATVSFKGNSAFNNAGCGSLGVPPTHNSPLTTRLIQ